MSRLGAHAARVRAHAGLGPGEVETRDHVREAVATGLSSGVSGDERGEVSGGSAVSRFREWSGRNWRVICGDVLHVLPTLDEASVDAVITDAPYSSGGAMRGDRTASTVSKYVRNDTARQAAYVEFAGDTRDSRGFLAWCALWYSEALRIARPGAPLVTFTDWRQLPITTDAVQAGGWIWRGIGVWDKTDEARPQKGRFRAQAEYFVWGSNGPMPMLDGAPCLPGVFRGISPRGDRLHIAQKPEAIMLGIVPICPPGGVVLDPFGGSGTTAVAAIRSGRSAVVVEVVETTAALIAERLAAEERHVGARDAEQMALLEPAPGDGRGGDAP